MSMAMPKFFDSEYYYEDEKGKGYLLEGAPQEIVDEFNEFIQGMDEEDCPKLPTKITLTEEDLKDL